MDNHDSYLRLADYAPGFPFSPPEWIRPETKQDRIIRGHLHVAQWLWSIANSQLISQTFHKSRFERG